MARKAVTNDFKVFSERLSVLMEERGMTQEKLAHELGIKRQTVSLYKNGQSTPDAAQLKNIAVFFDVSADWLLGLSDVRSQDITIQNISKKTGLSEAAVLDLGEMMQSQKKYAFSDFMECFEAMIERIKQNTRNS